LPGTLPHHAGFEQARVRVRILGFARARQSLRTSAQPLVALCAPKNEERLRNKEESRPARARLNVGSTQSQVLPFCRSSFFVSRSAERDPLGALMKQNRTEQPPPRGSDHTPVVVSALTSVYFYGMLKRAFTRSFPG